MIKLTANEGKTLEGILAGLSVPLISEKSGFGESTIRGHIRKMIRTKVITTNDKKRYNHKYELTGEPYHVEKGVCMPKIKISFDPGNDKLLEHAMNKVLTEDQMFYLSQHRDKPRTVLAKRLGLTKLQVIFALERLG